MSISWGKKSRDYTLCELHIKDFAPMEQYTCTHRWKASFPMACLACAYRNSGILPGEEMVYASIATSVISTNIPPSGNTVDRPVILLKSLLRSGHFVSYIVSQCALGAICAWLTCASTDLLALDYVASGSNRSHQSANPRWYINKKRSTTRADLFLLVEHQGLEPWTDRL